MRDDPRETTTSLVAGSLLIIVDVMEHRGVAGLALRTYETVRGHAGAINVAVPTAADCIRAALITPSPEATGGLPLQ